MDPAKIADELKWLSDNPQFEERPATLLEFLGPDYLGIADRVRGSIKKELSVIMGDEVSPKRPTLYQFAMITGGIGIGKTTVASIVLPYLAHWVLCLKDPQGFFNLLPGSRIAFMQMSTSEGQAAEVVFGDIKARIQHSPWFVNKYPYDSKFSKQIRFPKDIWVLPGDSAETSFEGYNILGGILDEADSHKVTKNKDYAEAGYTTISSRIESRFETNGFLLVIGQMKKGNGFASKKYQEFKNRDDAYAVRMSIWESMGWEHYRDKDTGEIETFFYDVKRKMIVPKGIKTLTGSSDVIEIPITFINSFKNDPEKALRDLAGIPPAVGDPFISLVHKIEDAKERWVKRHGSDEGPVNADGRIAKWFKNPTTPLKRVGHLDLAYSGDGDALGFAMGHVREVVEIDGEYKPYIVIDFLYRQQASKGTEIFIGDVRRLIYSLVDDFKFKIDKVTMDGFQCFTGETKVPLLDGRTLTMEELARDYPDGGFDTYSFDGSRIVPGHGLRAWRTGRKRVVTVTLDSGEEVRCTDDHRWMLRDGTYKMARDLVEGDSLMPLYRRVTPDDWKSLQGYEQVRQPGALRKNGEWSPGRWQYTHRLSGIEAEVVHHKNHNKLDNRPANLAGVTRSEHGAEHDVFGELWREDAEWAERTRVAVAASNSASVGASAKRRRHDITIEDCESVAHLPYREAKAVLGCSMDLLYARVREAGFDGWADFRAQRNHKVLSVVNRGEVEDVYDLAIEDNHNFAIHAGVFVHNSTDTKQQLRKRRIPTEHLSVDKDVLPYHDLKEALYEDRIEFPPYMVRYRRGDSQEIDILYRELTELVNQGDKIDHPPDGSKDVADAVAGVVATLMGDRKYHKKARKMTDYRGQQGSEPVGQTPFGNPTLNHPAYRNGQGIPAAPVAPAIPRGPFR